MQNSVNAECLKLALYADCRYAECRYGECRGTVYSATFQTEKNKNVST
jgi:hypothetical protein